MIATNCYSSDCPLSIHDVLHPWVAPSSRWVPAPPRRVSSARRASRRQRCSAATAGPGTRWGHVPQQWLINSLWPVHGNCFWMVDEWWWLLFSNPYLKFVWKSKVQLWSGCKQAAIFWQAGWRVKSWLTTRSFSRESRDIGQHFE